MSPQTIRTLRALLMLVAGLVLVTSPFVKIGFDITNKSCSPQPYDAFGPYCAGTVKTLYAFKHTCAIRIVKQADDLSGGYGTRQYTAPKSCAEGATTIDWREDAVIITTPEGPVTVPKTNFTGGR